MPLIREYFREKYELRKQRLGKLASLSVGPAIFPNEGWLGRVVRIMHPHGPGTTEIWTYFFVDKDAPQEVKSALGHYYEHYYGPGGMTQKDDMENWYQLTIASRGPMARKLDLNYQMGIDDPPLHGALDLRVARPVHQDRLQRREPSPVLPAVGRGYGGPRLGRDARQRAGEVRRRHG